MPPTRLPYIYIYILISFLHDSIVSLFCIHPWLIYPICLLYSHHIHLLLLHPCLPLPHHTSHHVSLIAHHLWYAASIDPIRSTTERVKKWVGLHGIMNKYEQVLVPLIREERHYCAIYHYCIHMCVWLYVYMCIYVCFVCVCVFN